MKKLTGQRLFGKTTAIIETPGQYNKNSKDFNEPLYPISKNEYNQLYEKYKLLADQFDRFYPIGRLADYKYYNMEDTILRTLRVFVSLYIKRECL